MSTMEATTRGQIVQAENADVTVVWTWTSDDPYAITATILQDGASVVWTFARELLTGALAHPGIPQGLGEVRVVLAPGALTGGIVLLRLAPPDQDKAIVAVPAEALHTLARRLGTAPSPEDAVQRDLDHELETILASS